jgi:hypothetical protein
MKLKLGIRVLTFLSPQWIPKHSLLKEETTQALSGVSHGRPFNLEIRSEMVALLQIQTDTSDAMN